MRSIGALAMVRTYDRAPALIQWILALLGEPWPLTATAALLKAAGEVRRRQSTASIGFRLLTRR